MSTPNVTHAPASLIPDWFQMERTRLLTESTEEIKATGGSSVVYWMHRDVRTEDNWALVWASHLAQSKKVPLHVVYALPPPPASVNHDLPLALEEQPMTERHGSFLLGGLECVHKELAEKKIPLHIVKPSSDEAVGKTLCKAFVSKLDAAAVVCDFSPLRQPRQWAENVADRLEAKKTAIPLYQVDAHNIVPVWMASPKREVGARTLRPKIHKVIAQYLKKCPKLQALDYQKEVDLPDFERKTYEDFLQMEDSVPAVDWAVPGTDAAKKQFEFFVQHGLSKFDTHRNNPNHANICSNLSPWINHGHISFQRLTMAVKKLNKYANGTAAYIEEGVIRRELSDNFLYYADDYDALSTAAGWAQETLQVHTSDTREYVYTLQELQDAQTHDDLWNAAQLQVVREGRMHGFLRMYWAKKILEWTETPDVALRTAQYLNDRFALDGKDPNGFTGVGWSIMGIHDMGWKERDIFGKIRYMNYAGCKRKFDVANFVAKYKGASENAIRAANKAGKKRSATSAGSSKAASSKKSKTLSKK